MFRKEKQRRRRGVYRSEKAHADPGANTYSVSEEYRSDGKLTKLRLMASGEEAILAADGQRSGTKARPDWLWRVNVTKTICCGATFSNAPEMRQVIGATHLARNRKRIAFPPPIIKFEQTKSFSGRVLQMNLFLDVLVINRQMMPCSPPHSLLLIRGFSDDLQGSTRSPGSCPNPSPWLHHSL